MKSRRNFLLIWLLIVSVIVGAMATTLQAHEGEHECAMDFEATVWQGPSAGMTFVGELTFLFDETGAVEGNFVGLEGESVPVAGQINGRAVNLIFNLGEDRYLFGVGTAWSPVEGENCGDVLGGPFTGPEAGDSGDWKGKGRPGPLILNAPETGGDGEDTTEPTPEGSGG